MGRIDEIKERNERRNKLMNERKTEFAITREVEYQGLVRRSIDDTQYLLSLLEIADEALSQIHELDDGDPNVSLSKIASSALQLIRS